MRRLRILPYNMGSQSVKSVCNLLNGLRIREDSRTFRPNPRRHIIINWGNTHLPAWWGANNTEAISLNHPTHVLNSSNKRTALTALQRSGIPVPEFTSLHHEALQWYHEGFVVVGRAILNGHGGNGCRIYSYKYNPVQPELLPLYTKHLRHKREFRIHVFNGAIIDQTEKLKTRQVNDHNSWIRNHDNGYIFARQGITVPDAVRDLALRAVSVLQLSFGAVDIGYREKEGAAYVFEVNTAPGLEGQTVVSYVNVIQELLRK